MLYTVKIMRGKTTLKQFAVIAALTASIKAFFPHLMAPQDAVGKVEGFIKQLAADQVLVIVAGGGLCLM